MSKNQFKLPGVKASSAFQVYDLIDLAFSVATANNPVNWICHALHNGYKGEV